MRGVLPVVVALAWRDLHSRGPYLRLFWASLVLGVTLVAASGGLLRHVSAGLLADTRALFGGDVEVEARTPLGPRELDWMRARGTVSLLIELRTMLLAGERFQLVELQSVDGEYPLYGEVELLPAQPVADAVERRDGVWGVALDRVLAERLGLGVGDRVGIGTLQMEVRAIIVRQPDRSLSADWRGPPVLVSADALAPSGVVMPGSRLEYEYRVRVDGDPQAWVEDLSAAFPDAEFEVHTFSRRRDRLSEVLDQIASGLLLVSFSTLLVGGLGVFNSVRAHLDTKLETIATLRALGLRPRSLAGVYLCQVLILAGSAGLVGAVAGAALSLAAAGVAAERLPVAPGLGATLIPAATAWLFGVLTAITFSLIPLGRALAVSPAVLFRGRRAGTASIPATWRRATAMVAVLTGALVIVALPQPVLGAGFVAAVAAILLLLEGTVRAVRSAARRLGRRDAPGGYFPLKLALANLARTEGPLRVTLLSLGTAVSVLVASTVVVAALLRTIVETIPADAPALVFYDVSAEQKEPFRVLVDEAATLERLELVPLVLGRLSRVDGENLRASSDAARALESRDEHKLTYRRGNIDQVRVVRGRWWPEEYSGPPLVAFEDREADQLGLEVGDRLVFSIMDRTVEAKLAAVYSQRGIGTRFWFEGMFSPGVLDPFVTRYVGGAYLLADEARLLEGRIAAAMPNVVTVRTERLLAEARSILARAAGGLAVVAVVTLIASLLVVGSMVSSTRALQTYEATMLHALGARLGDIRASLAAEYVLIAGVTSLFSFAFGAAIAGALLGWRIGLDPSGVWWTGACVAMLVSTSGLGAGAFTLLSRLRLAPAALLRSSV